MVIQGIGNSKITCSNCKEFLHAPSHRSLGRLRQTVGRRVGSIWKQRPYRVFNVVGTGVPVLPTLAVRHGILK